MFLAPSGQQNVICRRLWLNGAS